MRAMAKQTLRIGTDVQGKRSVILKVLFLQKLMNLLQMYVVLIDDVFSLKIV